MHHAVLPRRGRAAYRLADTPDRAQRGGGGEASVEVVRSLYDHDCSLAPIPLRQIGSADLADLRRVLPPPGEERRA